VNVTSRSGGFSVSATGVLSYRSSSFGSAVISELVWLDRKGEIRGTVGEKMDQTHVRLSPDDTRAAVSVLDSARRTRDIWIYDLAREGLRTRFTFDTGEDWSLAWSPDGRSLAFSGGRRRPVLNLYRKATDGSTAENAIARVSRWGQRLRNELVERRSLYPLSLWQRQVPNRQRPVGSEHRGRFEAARTPSDIVQRNRRTLFTGWSMGCIRLE
jgi:dipeptidyl aminopeptidase/acylaminoacyl peptidase